VATAYITDITPEPQRAQRFGLFQAMFGIGFIIGPVLGGVLGEHWVRAPFLAAALLNGLNLALALFVLPESRPGTREAAFDLAALNPFRSFAWALGMRRLAPFIAIFFIFAFVGQIYGTVWVLFGFDRFSWDSFMVGLSLGGFGVFHALAQAFLVGPVVARIGPRAALFLGMTSESAALLVTGLAPAGWMVFAVLPLYALGGVGVPALQSLTTQQVGEEHQGQLQGVLASAMSVASIFGPLFFSTLYFATAVTAPWATWVASVVIYVLAAPLIAGLGRSNPVAAAPP
jgi:DHA1 family tetracycline resistance protein-like MFS transporter